MDEMSPAYENFLNNMTRLGGSPRETTRRISASSFLGRDNIAKQVALNSRKITILKNVIQAQRVTTGAILATLSTPSEGIDQSIMDIKETMSSILQTLEAQEKFEYEKFLAMQRRLENEKRKKRETNLEKDKPIFNFFKKQVEKTVAPVRNGFLQFIGFFINLIAGKFLMGILKFLSNPRNLGIVNFIADFIKNFFPLILIGITSAIVGVAFLIGKMIGLTGIIKAAAGIFGFALPGGSLISGGAKTLGKSVKGASPKIFSKIAPFLIKMEPGGALEGPSHKDGGIPIEAEGGEFIVKKKEAQKPEVGAALELINAGKFDELAKIMSTLTPDDKISMHRSIESYFTDPKNQVYTETITDSEGNTTYKADMSGLERYKNFMTESYGGMSGYMPDIGKFAESTISGDTGKLATQFFTNRGTTMGAEINKVIPGTDEFFLNAVSQSINESVDAKRIKGTNNIPTITPPIEDSNDGGSTLDFSSLPSSSANDKSTTLRNELPSCSLNSSDSNKCDTLGMLMT